MLHKFEVSITENEQLKLQSLTTAWDKFQKMLTEVKVSLLKSKKNMRQDLEDALTELEEKTAGLRNESLANLPYGRDFEVPAAFVLIKRYEGKLKDGRLILDKLKPGLSLFNMELPDDKPLQLLETDLGLMTEVWTIAKTWGVMWDQWKFGKFGDIDVGQMEAKAALYNKNIMKLGRQIKKWKAWVAMKDMVVEFRQTLPLIMNLRNEAMRTRHWDQLMDEIGKVFDPKAEDFTLEKVFDLGLAAHGDFIGELSDSANKELAIEEALKGIDTVWKEIDIDMVEYKDIYYKIRSTEDLFAQLEDNAVALSTMKASRFYATFKEPITHWENTLSNMSEIIELALTVQRQWMHLESIFTASEDIRKQLPAESKLFDNSIAS